jgi:hypothetical protein
LIAASVGLAAVCPFAPVSVSAFPLQKPHASASSIATPTPPPNELPLDTTLTFVLDDKISSASARANDIVNAHLERALVVNGTTVAPAGSRVQIKIADAQPAQNPDIYGFVDIYFRPLVLPDGRIIPLHAPASHLSMNVSAGHDSTVAMENTIGDIFTPTLLLHVLRKGHNFVLEPGARVYARTDATVRVLPNGTAAIETPAPLVLDADTPGSSFRAMPMVTPQETPSSANSNGKRQRGKNSSPSPSPSSSPSPGSSPLLTPGPLPTFKELP